MAAYEQLSGSAYKNAMNHSLAVKQYSRSSADQESPLAHELRPVEVLQLTMGYLVHHIMDLCDGSDVNLAEWYHFVWDRTRGIRKDITQQELCCARSVQLVEQCARFHVHCAARLVAEDVSVFDDKINTENLTKCLQTLKYMYHDLRVKHNVACPNEAEFRAYIVLLNLNDGNFMWEVQQLHSEIQQSRQIKFAISVYSALDKNNYVRFFKLVQSTSYLNACILLRYFNQVRYRALLTIIKCFTSRPPWTTYPLEELYKTLALEDRPNTVAFVEYHGLPINPEGTQVILDRVKFQEPSMPFTLERAFNLVESKRQCSVGEIVCSTSLPTKLYETHIPHDSFEDNGYLKLNELPKDFQKTYQKFLTPTGLFIDADKPLKTEEPVSVQPTNKFSFSTPVGTFEQSCKPEEIPHIKPKGSFIFSLPIQCDNDSINIKSDKPDGETALSIFSTGRTKHLLEQEESRSQSPLLFQSKPESSCIKPNFWAGNYTSKSIFGNVKNAENDPMPIIAAPVKEKAETGGFSFVPSNRLPFTPIPKFTPPIVTTATASQPVEHILPAISVISKVPEKDHTKELLEKERKMKEELVKRYNEVKEREAAKKLEEEELKRKLELLHKKEELKRQELEIEHQRAQLLKMKRIKSDVKITLDKMINTVEQDMIKNRLNEISKTIKTRKLMTFAQKWRSLAGVSKKKRKNFFDNSVWVSSRSVSAEAQELYTSSQGLTLLDMKRYRIGTAQNLKLRKVQIIKPIDIYQLVWKILFEKLYTNNDSFNLNLYWKIGISIPQAAEVEYGLNRLENHLNLALQWSDTDFGRMSVKRIKSNNGGSLSYCVKHALKFEESFNGLAFINIEDEMTQSTLKRFNSLVERQRRHGLKTPLPLVIILIKYKNNNFETADLFAQQLKIDALVKDRLLATYKIFYCTDSNFVLILSDAVQFLAENYDDCNSTLEMNEMGMILRNCLSEELCYRLQSSALLNKRFNILLRNPNILINLYNEGLAYVLDVLFDRSVYIASDFPEEFRSFLGTEGQRILLPCTYEYFPEYWKNIPYLQKLRNFIKTLILPKFEFVWPPKNQEQLQEILSKYCTNVFNKDVKNIVYKILSILFKKMYNAEDVHELQCLSWLDIIQVIVTEKINSLQLFDTTYGVYTLVYRLDEMNKYRKSLWWFHLPEIQQHIRKVQLLEEECDTEPEIIEEDDCVEMDLDATLSIVRKNEEERDRKYGEFKEWSVMIQDLEESMEIQKKILLKFEETAKRALEY